MSGKRMKRGQTLPPLQQYKKLKKTVNVIILHHIAQKFSSLLQWKCKKCLTPSVEYILVREERILFFPKN